MKQARRGWKSVPACVGEELGIRRRAFYSDCVSSHDFIGWRTRYVAGKRRFWQAGGENKHWLLAVGDTRRLCWTASNPDLLILIASAYCSGLRCSRFNLN